MQRVMGIASGRSRPSSPATVEASASPAPPAGAAGDVALEAEGWVRLKDADAALVQGGGRAHVAISLPAGSSASLPPAGGREGAGPGSLPSGEGSKRHVTVLRTHGKLCALDAICYHAGGPLGLGDVEEVAEGRPCVRCPWHHYLVDLETGTKWYQPLQKDPTSGQLVPAGWKCTEKSVQRIHEVEERSGGIYVRLRLEGGERESDRWAGREDCFKSMAAQGQPGRGTKRGPGFSGADGRLPAVPSVPSGHVFQRPLEKR